MKRAIKACWTTSLQLLLAWIGLCATPGLAQPTDTDGAEHLVRALILEKVGAGFSAPPARIDLDTLPATWSEVDLPIAPVPSMLVTQRQVGEQPATVEHWYRFKLATPRYGLSHQFIYIPRWKSDGTIAVYGNGELLYQSRANLQWNGSNLPLWLALDELPGNTRLTEIAIRIQHLHGIGGALSTVWVGDTLSLQWRYVTRYFLQGFLPFVSSTTFLALGIFAFAVWLKRRDTRLYLLFFGMSVAGYIRTMHYYMGVERLLISDAWFGWLTVSSLFWIVLASHLFIAELHRQPTHRLTRLIIAVTLLENLATLPVLPHFLDATITAPWVYLIFMLLALSTYGIDLKMSLRAGARYAVILSCFALFSLSWGIYDWSLQNNHVDIENLFLGAYSNFGIFYFFAYVIFRHYIDAIQQVEQVNAGLAQRLQERETALLESHRLLREAEQKETLRVERQRMMQDMHDGLGSSLRTALLSVEKGRPTDSTVAEVLQGCIDDLKLAIDSMEPVQADLLLLLATWRFRLEPRLDETGITLLWEVADVPALDWLDPRSALHILRILQEALSNIIKHAHATEIRVATRVDGDQVLVTVTDNGQGFALDPAQRSGKGLSNQMRRAEAIGARFEWHSSSVGTCVTLQLPIKKIPRTETKIENA